MFLRYCCTFGKNWNHPGLHSIHQIHYLKSCYMHILWHKLPLPLGLPHDNMMAFHLILHYKDNFQQVPHLLRTYIRQKILFPSCHNKAEFHTLLQYFAYLFCHYKLKAQREPLNLPDNLRVSVKLSRHHHIYFQFHQDTKP